MNKNGPWRRYVIAAHTTVEKQDMGNTYHRTSFCVNGLIHREGDLPALIWSTGDLEWYQRGKCHRDGDKPAKISTGKIFLEWFQHGERHRDGDKPAFISKNTYEAFYKHGRFHRDGDQPARIWSDEKKEWWKNGTFIKRA